jgi:hypothetical protein
MPAPLQVGCQVKAKVGPLVEHAKPDGTKAKRRQKSFMTGPIVAAKGPSVSSVCFDNGRTEDISVCFQSPVCCSPSQHSSRPSPCCSFAFAFDCSQWQHPPTSCCKCALAVPPLETTQNEVAQTSLINTDANPELAGMPALLDPPDPRNLQNDDDDNTEHSSNEEGNNNPDDHFLAANDDNKEDAPCCSEDSRLRQGREDNEGKVAC